jgi:hypothetical protein
MNFTVELNYLPRRFLQLQLATIAGLLLLLLSFLGSLFRYAGLGRSSGLGYFFVDAEANIATWYSSALLLLCAILSSSIASILRRNRKPYFWHWRSLAIVFLYLSIDETAIIHERLSRINDFVKTDGLRYAAWTIPACIIVGIFVIFYLQFLAHLRPKTKRLFWLSGITYIMGAIGFELIGVTTNAQSSEALSYIITAHFEEGLELLGLAIFLYGLLDYLSFILQGSEIYIRKKDKNRLDD